MAKMLWLVPNNSVMGWDLPVIAKVVEVHVTTNIEKSQFNIHKLHIKKEESPSIIHICHVCCIQSVLLLSLFNALCIFSYLFYLMFTDSCFVSLANSTVAFTKVVLAFVKDALKLYVPEVCSI